MLERFFARILSDKQIQKRYKRAGANFGSAVSYLYMGECVGFEGLLRKWEAWEIEYIKRGFRTLPIDDFINYGGYGHPLVNLGIKLVQGEEPIFHAKIYRNQFLGKVEPTIDLFEMIKTGEPVVGTYSLPSTKTPEK